MSDALYSTRLRWWWPNGVAKLHGYAVKLTEPPVLADFGKVEGLDYCPEVGVAQIMYPHDRWRDMTQAEIAACDRVLRTLCKPPPESKP